MIKHGGIVIQNYCYLSIVDWLRETEMSPEFKAMAQADLAKLLSGFYVAVCKQDGNMQAGWETLFEEWVHQHMHRNQPPPTIGPLET